MATTSSIDRALPAPLSIGADRSMDAGISLMQKPDDSAAAAVVWPQSYVLALARPSCLAGDGEEGDQAVLLGDTADFDDDDEAQSCDCARCRVEMEPESEEESEDDAGCEEFYDSDDDSYYCEESDGEIDVPLKIEDGDEAAEASGGDASTPPLVSKRVVVPEGRFLEPARRFASAGSAAGFMRVAVVEPSDRPDAAGSQEQAGKQILILYGYTQFSAASDGGGGVEVCGSTKLHQLRFVVPPADDASSSLPWAGSSLAPLIYPARQRKELQALWSRLVSKVTVPPRAKRVQVIVDVGILRQEHYTWRHMKRVRAALKGMMVEEWPGYHVAMELQLPEPVRCVQEAEAADGEEGTDRERPAKRRKVVAEAAGQECSVCFELLESDLAVWPGCSLPHVFHGACLEQTLKGNEMCPICRRKLSALNT